MTAEEYSRAERVLARRDPVMAAIIRQHGPCGLAGAQREDPFRAIVEAIVWQQLSGKAAATIFERFLGLFPDHRFPTPDDVSAVTDAHLRAIGFSRQKIAYLRDLCGRMQARALPLDRLESMDDEAVIEALTAVKGIGRWTAEMVLMFKLQRADVLPVGDLGIVKAIRKAYLLCKDPDADRIRRIGEKWRPYRSIAAWYLWQMRDNAPLDEK